MDRLDKVSLVIIVVLASLAASLVVIETRKEGPARKEVLEEARTKRAASPDFEKRVQVARELLNAENLAGAEELLRGLAAEFPYEGDPHLLLGDLAMRRQDAVLAMVEYRKAVELNPDFLDKKAPAFQGKKIRATVEEAAGVLEKGMENRPDASRQTEYRDTLKYMRRRIAGSCG